MREERRQRSISQRIIRRGDDARRLGANIVEKIGGKTVRRRKKNQGCMVFRDREEEAEEEKKKKD
jgi:hypothetical protein